MSLNAQAFKLVIKGFVQAVVALAINVYKTQITVLAVMDSFPYTISLVF